MDTIAGFSAGCVTTLVMHPLDLVKVRIQADTAHHGLSAYARVGRGLLQSHSVFGLYRGLGPNLAGNAIAWGFYFTLYQDFVRRLSRLNSDDNASGPFGSGPTTYLVSSFAAGGLTGFLTNPIWVIKTRMLATNRSDPRAYKSVLQGVREVFSKEGITGFWKGFTPGLMGIAQNAIQFAIYDSLKLRYGDNTSDRSKNSTKLETSQYLTFSAVAKLVATVLTYPYQVVRTRMQLQSTHRLPMLTVIANVYRKEGVSALYKGLLANLLRVVPATCTTLVVYENVRVLSF